MEENYPIYDVVLKNEKHGLEFFSFTADPAILEMGLAFAKEIKNTSLKFNKDKQVVVGPTMIPGLLVLQKVKGQYMYIRFSKEVIESIVEKFNKEDKEHKINMDHSDVVESAFIKSNWIKEDMKFDKSNMYGFDLPIGTHFIEAKVDDVSIWENEIKDNGKFGFSIEGVFGLDYQEFSKKIINNKMEENKVKLEGEGPSARIELPVGVHTIGDKVYTVIEVVENAGSEDELIYNVIDTIVDSGSGSDEGSEEANAEEPEKDKEVEASTPVKMAEGKEVEASTPVKMAEGEEEGSEGEESSEESSESSEDSESTLDEKEVLDIIQPKIDEVIAMIAELKSLIETDSLPNEDGEDLEEDSDVNMSEFNTRLYVINKFTKQFV